MKERYCFSAPLPEALRPLPGSAALGEASADDLRVLLCFAALGEDATRAALAEAAGCSLSRVAGALAFWQEAGILKTDDTCPTREEAVAPARPLRAKHALGEQDTKTIARRIEARSLRPFLDDCQQAFGRVFNDNETAILVGMLDELGLSEEYILTLISYNLQRGKRSLHYIEKMAFSLCEREILTPEALDAYLAACEKLHSNEGQLRRLFGIGERALSAKESACFTQWLGEWGMDVDCIGLAYDEMVNATGKYSVAYLHRILTHWNEEGCRTQEAAAALLEKERLGRKTERTAQSRKAKTAPKPQLGNFDTDDFFTKALQRSYAKKE